MPTPDATIFALLADPVCKRILLHLVKAGEPCTQRVLTSALGLNSSTISRRMSDLEAAGLLSRRSSHAAYELSFPHQIHQLLLAEGALVFQIRDCQAQEAAANYRQLQDAAPEPEPDPDAVRRMP